MPKHKRHPIQTVELGEFPRYLEHKFEEGDVVVVREEGGHKMRVLKDLIRNCRKVWRRINEDKGIYRKERFGEKTRESIWREYRLITKNRVIVGRSPRFGLPVIGIANVCYLVGGNGYSGLNYEYDVCFVDVEQEESRGITNRVCLVWTLWEGALEER